MSYERPLYRTTVTVISESDLGADYAPGLKSDPLDTLASVVEHQPGLTVRCTSEPLPKLALEARAAWDSVHGFIGIRGREIAPRNTPDGAPDGGDFEALIPALDRVKGELLFGLFENGVHVPAEPHMLLALAALDTAKAQLMLAARMQTRSIAGID